MSIRRNQQGFTILELMIATTVFSVILLVVTFGLLQVGRMFYKGVTMTRTQEAARNIMDEISQNIQFSGEQIFIDESGPVNKLCIGNRRYSYIKGRMLSDTPSAGQLRNVLVVDNDANNCTADAPQPIDQVAYTLSNSAQELLEPRMRLSELSVSQSGNGLYDITVRVVYGDDGLITSPANAPDARCELLTLSSQFCAVSELRTTVLKRINVE